MNLLYCDFRNFEAPRRIFEFGPEDAAETGRLHRDEQPQPLGTSRGELEQFRRDMDRLSSRKEEAQARAERERGARIGASMAPEPEREEPRQQA